MNFRYIKQSNKQNQFSTYRAQGMRRLNATEPKQQQLYIDIRNLWKGSTASQQKQYDSIRKSGLLNGNRKLTFMKFNYRTSEERNVCYPDVFQVISKKQKQQFAPKSKLRIKRLKQDINCFKSRIEDEIKQNHFTAQKNWLEEYHETQKQNRKNYKKKQYIPIGTMNVSDLWGDKQLQECLGFLPCKRDRPKMLKFYSSKITRRKDRKVEDFERRNTEQ